MRYFLFILCLTLLLPAPAFAQLQSPLAGPQYRFMARNALENRPANFDFMAFRTLYSETGQYDPLGQSKDWLLKYAYTAQTDPDKAKQKKALDDYVALLMEQFANIDVVTQALSLSRQDPRFGDPAFFEWLRAGLIQSVVKSGDGGSLFRAYDVLTMGEETELLIALNVKVLKTDARESAGLYYNMHEVEDAGHEGSYTIFVDVSRPMAWLEQKKREKKGQITIPRQ